MVKGFASMPIKHQVRVNMYDCLEAKEEEGHPRCLTRWDLLEIYLQLRIDMWPEDIHAPAVGKDFLWLCFMEVGRHIALVMMPHQAHVVVHTAFPGCLCCLLAPANLLAASVCDINNPVWKLQAEPFSNGLQWHSIWLSKQGSRACSIVNSK